ncbi:type IV toxin-antitoxin system AbiEi family antitoxin domain-containing protein [Glaciibacter superstes]|uniref:type IV toxin-antitoxin system AbiEi family antitoxin domain-containing protein n=1 Tax=Glaciibacter superstes TaxID=501023 RepID=UPI00146CD604|nr:type IV toxin-antitoxin system AbiEi family antitoxin domain-containing protein [Glaciibacter superstes]
MRDQLETVAARDAGLLTTAALQERGISPHRVGSLVSSGVLVRVRHGMYVEGSQWRAATADERYVYFVRATAAGARRPAVLSHVSAAALHGLPTVGPWPRAVHTIDEDATGGSNGRFTVRHRNVAQPGTVRIQGIVVTSLVRTLIDVATTSSFLVGVVMVDHALGVEQRRVRDESKLGIRGVPALTKADLLAELERVNPRTGAQRARQVIHFANALSANPGETLGRVRMFELGFEVPELQVHFAVNGNDYWVDYFWRGVRKIGEFDGLLKYTRGAVLGDRDPADVVVAEKLHEDELRPLVNSFCRWTWDIAISPRLFHRFLLEHDVPRA